MYFMHKYFHIKESLQTKMLTHMQLSFGLDSFHFWDFLDEGSNKAVRWEHCLNLTYAETIKWFVV